uniref:Uncharacterized protein n=1 Tax=Geladintestivirus 1 TaxID=3233133 RepID=A0AAU8MIK5_9CAUD
MNLFKIIVKNYEEGKKYTKFYVAANDMTGAVKKFEENLPGVAISSINVAITDIIY